MKKNKSIFSPVLTILLVFSFFLASGSAAHVHAVACTFTFNANSTIGTGGTTSPCTIAADAVDGCDVTSPANSESSATNACVLTLNGGAVTVSQGVTMTTIQVGSLSLTNSSSMTFPTTKGQMIIGNKAGAAQYVVDADADGWSANINTISTATASGKRRRALMRGTAADCNDASYNESNVCWSYAYGQAWYYGYGQAWYYGYGQAWYYGYGQAWYYGYGQGWYYGYGQGGYWGYGYGEGNYKGWW